jgi:peptide/nickel transport system permease protein
MRESRWHRAARWGSITVVGLLALGGALLGGEGRIDLDQRLLAPGPGHWLGTDAVGRDLLTRIVSGASLSLRISLAAWLAALLIGLVAGALAGYYAGTPLDWLVSWLIALAYATPFLILLLGLLAVIGPGLVNAYLILVAFAWAAPARQTRVSVRVLRGASFLTACRAFGYPVRALLRYAILPSVARPTVVASLAILPEIIALDAALSFFGLGAQPPTPSLGRLVADGVHYGASAWWLGVYPVIILATLCLLLRLTASGRAP